MAQNQKTADEQVETGIEKDKMVSLLSPEERDRIRAEMVFREEIQKALSTDSGSKHGTIGFLNTPFVVTLVGGLILAVVTSLLQTNSARNERESIRQQLLQDRKIILLQDFSNDFGKLITLKSTLKLHGIRLIKGSGVPETIESREDVRRLYEEELKEYRAHRPLRAWLVLINAMFKDW